MLNVFRQLRFPVVFCMTALLTFGGIAPQLWAQAADNESAASESADADSITDSDSKEIAKDTADGTTEDIEPASAKDANPAPKGVVQKFNDAMKPVDEKFGQMNGAIASVIFYPIPLPGVNKKGEQNTVQLAVLVLILGATFFTLRMGFINVRGFKHAVLVTAGRYDNPDDEGEVTHFQALTAALSATVGLGNIAGVAVAIGLGGPGATFWMILAGFLGMTSKFVECTLGQRYREERPDGRIMGGAMYYLSRGLSEIGLAPLGKVLAVLFAILCIGGSFAGGNSFQVNQSLGAVGQVWTFLAPPQAAGDADYRWVYGLVMATMTGLVIIGGIRRIASAAEKIVPTMCGIYVLAALVILLKNAGQIPSALALILNDAFTGKAVVGGFIGVLVLGFKRAAFSNEAGVGSAAIAHAAAKTDYPVREGVVALLGPFIDTVVICTMTALVIVITGAWNNPEYADLIANDRGAELTSLAMDSQINGFKYVLAVAVVLFAFSTMISWSYYGERCWAFLFGDRASMSYRIIFLIFTFLGSILSARNVLEFGDLMILGMAIPNIIGVVLLSGKVRKELDVYWQKLKDGEFKQNGNREGSKES